MAGFQPLLSKEDAYTVDTEYRDAEAERLFDTRVFDGLSVAQSPARFADAFVWVHVGYLVGVDYYDAELDTWLGVEFYETDKGDEDIDSSIRQDSLAFIERTGHEVAHVTIDREEARVRAQQARLATQEAV